LVFRNQSLTHAQQVKVANAIGPVPRNLGPRILETTGLLGAGELAFHSDLAFDPHPHLAVTLHALQIEPAGATSTIFVDCVDALERLPEATRARVSDLHALHVFPLSTEEGGRAERPEHYPRAVHPVAWKHPETGVPALYVNAQATMSIVGLDRNESDVLLDELLGVLYGSATRYEHRWESGDVVLWDNRSVQHARGNQEHMTARVLQRVIVDFMTFEERYRAFLESDAARLRSDPALQKV
jgi:taurine dioxygenase